VPSRWNSEPYILPLIPIYYYILFSYPTDNCAAQFGTSAQIQIPQDIFVNYLNHNAGQNLVQPYLNSAAVAQAAGKPLLMFETNTASCGGFPGISDSFGAALWLLDYGLQMAYGNFSGALVHVGGQNVYYNVGVVVLLYQRKVN
jgi:hypothetical protein